MPQKKHNHFSRFIVVLLISQLLFITAFGQEKFINELEWQQLPALPPAPGQDVQPGVAAPFSGVSANMLLVAGGCNFPDKPVWEDGRKAYTDDAFALEHTPDGEYIWHTNWIHPKEYNT